MEKRDNILETLILGLPKIKNYHATTSEPYGLLKEIAIQVVKNQFGVSANTQKDFSPFGEIVFPYVNMGAVDSLDLFGLDELIIFSFYWANRNRYRKVLDIGGNIGLHSIVMNRCGFEVVVFEPDPTHFNKLKDNLVSNHALNVTPVNAAVSTQSGNAEFVRVLGNTTANHIKGSKNPYGELEHYIVKTEDIKDLIQNVDLIKMDVEGHEKEIVLSLGKDDWSHLDMLVEVGSAENAIAIFEHLKEIKINAFSQKKQWQKVSSLGDFPASYKEGTLFISRKDTMPWETESE